METITRPSVQLKTNIKCGGCVATVTPFLNETVGEGNWEVDIQNPDKVLTVTKSDVSTDAVKKAVLQAGYRAEVLPAHL